jgi:sodium/hydrogen antiporter
MEIGFASALLLALPPLAAEEGGFDEHRLAIYLGALGLVVIFSALVSGFVERGPFSQVIVFIALGVIAGPWGLDIIDFAIDSPAIQTVGTISLVLVFFTDAIKTNLGQLRQSWFLPALALGPGALITIVLISLAAKMAFDLSWTLVFLIGAILASTDAVLLRDVLNDTRVPRSVRHTLSVEAGTNDVIVLPIILVLATIAAGTERTGREWGVFALDLYLLGPLAGVIVAYICTKLMSALRRRRLVRRDYESLYSIGVAFLAFATAQLIGGSGFLAAFTAGLTIALMDDELCECFTEYGETTAELAMLLTFVFLGAALLASAQDAFSLRAILFAAFVLLVARPIAFLITLARAQISQSGKLLLAWFGPRGLNSLLLTILAVLAGIPMANEVFGIVSVVVLASVVVHGMSATPVISWYAERMRRHDLPEETAVDAATLLQVADETDQPDRVPRMTPAELFELLNSGRPVTVVDVRRLNAFESDPRSLPRSLRIPIDSLSQRLAAIPKGPPVVLSCA